MGADESRGMADMDEDGRAVPFGEFLGMARDEGLVALEVEVVQAPTQANSRCAVVQVIARTAQGAFGAVGEASPDSAPPEWLPFLTTLAELRAKSRALRELTGLDHPVAEELAVPYSQIESDAGPHDPDFGRPAPFAEAPRFTPSARPTRPDRTPVSSTPISPPPVFPTPVPPADDERGDGPDALVTPASPMRAPEHDIDDQNDLLPPDHDAITPDMVAKLKKLATSIASLEGTELSDTEAVQKLDDFFLRAFKHPLSRATRMEGQRVVQRLSSDLARRRVAAPDEHE